MTTELKVYRRSELESISDGCLHRYRAIWRDGVDDTSDIALVGIGFAAIKHNYLMRLMQHSLPSDAEEAQAAFIEGVAGAKIPARLLPELRQVWNFHAERFELDIDRFVAAEERGSSGQVGWAPDLVMTNPAINGLEVIDDKAGWQPPITEEELRGLFQARVYSRYARDRWPHFSHYSFTINAVRFNKRVTVSFTPEELDTVDIEIAAAIATIEEAERTGEWPAIPGPSCRFCTLACPIADEKQLIPKRLTREQWQQLGAWLLPAEKQMLALKKLMKAGCATYGPCDIGGVVWDNRPLQSRAYPIQDVLDVLRNRNLMGAFDQDGLTISHSALAKLIKKFPMLADDLKPFVSEKTTWRFSARKPEQLEAGDDDE